MKKIFITIIALVLVIGGLFLVLKGEKLEAPTQFNSNKDSGVINTGMPVIDAPDTEEKLVTQIPAQTQTSNNFQTDTAVKEFFIKGQNFSFTPSLITVKKGDKVKITFNNSEGFHNFIIDEFGVATKQTKSPSQEVLEFTADKVGNFEYYCSVGTHRALGMKGTLKVIK